MSSLSVIQMDCPKATVVITTKNRKDDLRRAVVSSLSQIGLPLEVLVIDDGSSDGTSDVISREFPSVRLIRSETSRGYIVQRNYAASLARAPVIFSIDDDAEFSTPRVVVDTLQDFSDDCIGAVAIPFINVNRSPKVMQRSPSHSEPHACATYIGTAHAVRKDIFLSLGGYREQLVHQCEEMDFCIRMLDEGRFVRLGSADPIFHYESPRRSSKRIVFYNARNHVLFSWHNVPLPRMPIQMLGSSVHLVRHGLRERFPIWTAQGLASGVWAILTTELSLRAPVRATTFTAFRHMYGQPRPVREMRDRLAR